MEAAGGGAAPGCIDLHDFSGQLGEQRVHFHAMRLQDSLFLWVGAAPALSSLAVAMCSPRDSVPVSTSLLGDPSDTASACLAQRLGTCGAAGPNRSPGVGLGAAGAPRVGGAGGLPAGQEECFWGGRGITERRDIPSWRMPTRAIESRSKHSQTLALGAVLTALGSRFHAQHPLVQTFP
uniref:Proteasome assembly chaperone 4 n=1 Tax=Phasianus colchicus TaxID=9054 RepID=A0A669PDM0_PHACC